MKVNNCASIAELICEMDEDIKENVVQFLSELDSNGGLTFYNNASPYVKRIMFYENYTPSMEYRKMLKNYLCGYRSLDNCNAKVRRHLLKDEAEKRDKELGNMGFNNWYAVGRIFEKVNEARERLYNENPILNDANISLYIRKGIVDKALANDKELVYCEKELDKALKSVVSYLVGKNLNLPFGDIRMKNYVDRVLNENVSN